MGLQEQVMASRSWVQKAGEWIPGFRGYYAREHRRDADRLLREAVCARLKSAADVLGERSADLARQRRIDEVEALQRLSQRLASAGDRIRTAAQGYSGFFDAVKVLEPELDRLYAQDQRLFRTAEDLKAAAAKGELDAMTREASALEAALDARKEVLLDLSQVGG